MNWPDYDPRIADRDGYGNVTVKGQKEPCGMEVCGTQDFCKHCPASGTRHCPHEQK